MSFYWPVTARYALYGRWNHDLVSGRMIEGIAGIEYNDCCWRSGSSGGASWISPAARSFEDVDADEGVSFSSHSRAWPGSAPEWTWCSSAASAATGAPEAQLEDSDNDYIPERLSPGGGKRPMAHAGGQ